MVNKAKTKRDARIKRHKRVRAKISGTAQIPRLSVFRSNKGLFIQLIDDEQGKTLASVSSTEVKGSGDVESAKKAGEKIAKKAQEKSITKVVFDRGGYRYHGRIKAVADGAREAGLDF